MEFNSKNVQLHMKSRNSKPTSVRALHALLRVPASPIAIPSQSQLADLEREFQLLHQYDAFVWQYGAGEICDFLRIYVPNCENRFMDFRAQNRAHARILRQSVSLELSIPFRDVEHVVSFGDTDNGDVLFWDTAEKKIVVFCPRDGSFAVYLGGIIDFLEAVLSRRVKLSVFPADFSPDVLSFRPMGVC